MQRMLLEFHRWLAIMSSLPLVVLVSTGLVLTFEPAAHLLARKADSLKVGDVIAILDQHDPQGVSGSITYRNYEGTLSIGGVTPSGPIVVDVATRETRSAPGALARTFLLARALHTKLLYDLKPLVVAATVVLIVLALLGVAMGWPRFENTLSGWHMTAAWIGLPLILLTSVTGLLIAFGVMFGGGGGAPKSIGMRKPGMSMAAVVEAAGRSRDMSGMVWIRAMGPRHMMRYTENGHFRGYFVVSQGVVPVPRNWPRSIHEGLWSVPLGFAMNLAVSLSAILAIVTGLLLWLRRRRVRAIRIAPT